MFALLFMSVALFGQEVADSTGAGSATITYDFGDSIKEFLTENWKALLAVALFFISEWFGETDMFPEGSIWRKVINWILAFAKKKVTQSPKIKKVNAIYNEKLNANKSKINSSKGFKMLIFAVVLSGLTLGASAQKSHPFRIYPFQDRTELNLSGTTAGIDSTVFFGAAIGYDVFVKEMKSGDYSVGTMPGFGYGIKWAPKWNPVNTQSFLSFDVFVESKLGKDVLDELGVPTIAKYFDIKVLPMVGILDWVHIGYGPLFKVGVNGSEGYTDWMFAISISKTL